MAKAKRPSRGPVPAAKRDSSPALVIALVFSLLIAITLGVLFYLEKDKVAQAKKNETEKITENKRLQDAAEANDKLIQQLRVWLSPTAKSITDAEYKDLVQFVNDKIATGTGDVWPKWYPEMKRVVEGDSKAKARSEAEGLLGPNYPNPKTVQEIKPLTDFPSFRKMKDRYEAEVAALATTVKDLEAALQKVNAEYKDYRDNKWNPEIAQKMVTDATTKLNEAHQVALAAERARYQALERKLGEVNNEVEQRLALVEKRIKEEKDRYQAAMDEAKNKLEEEAQALAAKFKVKQDVHLNEPRGKIVNAESRQSGEFVYIDLGSESKVPLQQTFSVHGRGPGDKPLPEPKAKIQVIAHTSRDRSMCRVTEVAKPEQARNGADPDSDKYWLKDPKEFWRVLGRSPILPGDLLYTPAWSPNQQVHIAIAGIIDLDGDGQDDLEMFKRLLTERGTVIDAYLDPSAQYEQKGRITAETELLVLGERPSFAGAGVDPAKKDRDPYDQLQREAGIKGLDSISLKRFLTRMGYSELRISAGKGSGGYVPAPAPPGGGVPMKEIPK